LTHLDRVSKMISIEMIKSAPKIDILGNTKLTLAPRLILGLTLLVFGASKLSDLAGFADTVISYKVLPESLAVPYGYALPGVEVIVGLLLILGLGLKFVAPVAILIIASFIAGSTGNLYLAETKVSGCGCFGGLDWKLSSSHIIAQVVMLIMATQIWLHKGEFWSLDKRLLGRE
jgi:uncharacterized membrane protein YphA (DoxX/SURF4 family)